jgi:vesicular inhibitory amino acid transporter
VLTELATVCVVVLFSDSMGLLFPELMAPVQWKVLCTTILLPLHFLPLRLLSVTSVIGIFSCLGIVTIVVLDGLIKPTTPGSLIEPASTYLLPKRWSTLPLSFGLLLSPWGGHSVFPNIYRDMRHPYKYKRALKITYVFTYLLDAITAVAGILMFGDDVRDAITSNILRTTGYPRALTALMCAFIAIIPLTKIPLNARPIINTIELVCGVHYQQHHPLHHVADGARPSETYFFFMKVFSRVLALATFLVISIVFPAFDSIMAFMGSALCFTICVILPLAFYLRLFRNEISTRERLFAYFLMAVCSVISAVGTVWAFLPKSLIGAD